MSQLKRHKNDLDITVVTMSHLSGNRTSSAHCDNIMGGDHLLGSRFFHQQLKTSIWHLGLVYFSIVVAYSGEIRPFAKVRPLGLTNASWTTGFWADRLTVCSVRTIPAMGKLMSETNYSHYLENFRIAAGLKKGNYRGAPFNDGDFYKWLESACAIYAFTHNNESRERIEESVDIIARAQRSDGYLHTQVLVNALNGRPDAKPFQDKNNFELYNMGHLMSAACVHYKATGNKKLLEVAQRAANFLETTFQNAPPQAARASVCPSHYMGLIDLYRETGVRRYLELAQTLFTQRSQIVDGGDDNQDRIAFEKQTEAVGHAVRANYLYAGAADLYLETGDPSLWSPLETIWQNLKERKMYITGGCGALYDGASPDASPRQRTITRIHQAYGRNYQLPNVTAHCETCANIGSVLWNWRMYQVTGEEQFIDMVELALYNSVLSGVSLGGTNFLYTNPLRVTSPLPVELRWSRTRVPYVSSFCCPPNIARILVELSQMAYAQSPGALWVNLYGGNKLEAELKDIGAIKLVQETEYPWSGRVRFKFEQCDQHEFALKLRIPAWVENARIHVNQRPEYCDALPGSYALIRRKWKQGDIIDLDLPMKTRLIESNPLVEETFNQLAVKRGPLVYCLESADLPKGTSVLQVAIPPEIQLSARYDRRILDSVVLLEGYAELRKNSDWNGRLYREFDMTKSEQIKIRLIPYYAWGNRGEGEMTVWMPRSH